MVIRIIKVIGWVLVIGSPITLIFGLTLPLTTAIEYGILLKGLVFLPLCFFYGLSLIRFARRKEEKYEICEFCGKTFPPNEVEGHRTSIHSKSKEFIGSRKFENY